MTSELNREAAELMKEGRSALKPAAADKARVLAALQARLPTAPELAAHGPAQPSTGLGIGTKGLLLVTGVVAVVGAVIALRQSEPRDVSNVAPSAVVAPLPTAPVDLDVAAAPNLVPAPIPAASSTVLSTPAPKTSRAESPDRLAEEVALLTRAERAYHAGDLSRALSLVDQHRREFPRGTLGQERVHLRLQVLCGLGRVSEAKAEQARLVRLAPGRAAAGDVCGGKP